MRGYLVAILVGGVVLPLLLHFISPSAMAWWPDTISFGFAGAVVAPVMLWRTRADREFRHRVWSVIKAFTGRPAHR